MLKVQVVVGNFGVVLESVLLKIVDMLVVLLDEDVNVVIYLCLSVVFCQYEKGWMKVFDQGVLMFDDMDLFIMLQLVVWVVVDSLGNFLKEFFVSEMFILLVV